MRALVVVVGLMAMGCSEPPEEEEPSEDEGPPECAENIECELDELCREGDCRSAQCGELIAERGLSCAVGSNSDPFCEDPNARVLPTCRCRDGFLNLDTDSPGCEDLTPIYQGCCNCLSAGGCLSTSAGQCVTALENGAEVGTDTGCPADECPGDCSLVDCDSFGCTGY